jgi:putative PIN family toxin of toxin-antitoxin system
LKVVLDTNILISALLVPGSLPHQVVLGWRARRFSLLTCEQQFDEMRRITRLDKLRGRLRPNIAGKLVNELHAYAELHADLPPVYLSPDPDDNWLIALAETGGADFLVTGDKADLLSLGRSGRTQIVTARQLLDAL